MAAIIGTDDGKMCPMPIYGLLPIWQPSLFPTPVASHPHVEIAELASSVFHKLVQINVEIGACRFDYACTIGLTRVANTEEDLGPFYRMYGYRLGVASLVCWAKFLAASGMFLLHVIHPRPIR